MNHSDPCASCSPRVLSIVALATFFPVVISFAVAPGALWAEYLGLFFHLTLFLLVAKLPSPAWAQAAGYGWLVLDVTTGISILNGVPHAVADYVRLGGHVFGGIWIAVASLRGPRSIRLVGSAAGAWLGGYSFVSPFLPPPFLAPASILVLAWLALLAWRNGTDDPPRSA